MTKKVWAFGAKEAPWQRGSLKEQVYALTSARRTLTLQPSGIVPELFLTTSYCGQTYFYGVCTAFCLKFT